MLGIIGKEFSPVVLVVLMVKIFVPVQEVEEGAGGNSELNYWNNSCVFWLHEFVSPPPVSPANASACSGGGEATTGKPFGKISNLGLTEGGVL